MKELRSRWLTTGGWIAAVMLAALIIASFGPIYLIYPCTFLIIGSLLSKLNRGIGELDDSNGRKASQVFANAGVGMLCCIFALLLLKPDFDVLFILSFAIALSDTSSSEIGKFFKGATYDLITFKKVDSGLSGGVSWQGTLGGFLGGCLIPLIAWAFNILHPVQALVLSLISFLGMILDSVLGSTVQGKYVVEGRVREAGTKEQLIRGMHMIDNNLVNFISIFITTSVYALIIY